MSRWSRAARLKVNYVAHDRLGGYDADNPAAPSARCPICLDSVAEDAELPCGDPICMECIVQFVESLVSQGKVSDEDIACPVPSCRAPLSCGDVQRILQRWPGGEGLLVRLLDFQAQRFVPEPGEDERFLCCPSPGCGKVLVPAALVETKSEVECPSCNRRFCAGCVLPAHPSLSCEEAELEGMGPELRKLISQQNWKRCPACRSLCERESGCNFMTCPSEQCQGKTFFCYLCGELLTAADHAAHYEGFDGAVGRMGPFGSVCWNKRELDLSLPSKPPPPRLGVVPGDDAASIALRITWGEHLSEPPTIYYKVQLLVPGSTEVHLLMAQAGQAYHDVRHGVPKYMRYQAVVVPVNVNGNGPASERSEVVHFHPREICKETQLGALPPKSKRWVKLQ